MADRRAQILVLLATRFDGLPVLVRRDGGLSGFVHGVLAPVVCSVCEGVDDARRCPVCRGRGWVEVSRGRDPYSVDHVAAAGTDRVKVGFVAERDAEIARLGEQTAPPGSEADLLEAANLRPFGWELARAAMYARFDYAALDRGLERLAGMAVGAYTERGLELLDGWLPVPLRAPAESGQVRVVHAAARGRGADPRARDQRDQAVIELRAEGLGYVEIALRVGLSVRQLRRIVNRTEGT